MENGFDADTGEVLGPSVAAAKVSADAWRQRRFDEKGMGYTGLYDALERAYKKIPGVIINDSTAGDKFKFRYASLKQIMEKVRGPLLEFGVIIRQGAEHSQKLEGALLVPVYTDLIHTRTGEISRTKIDIPIVKFDPQSVGSAITYGKRYTLMDALGIATDDDDDGAAAKPNDMKEEAAALMIAEIKKRKTVDDLAKWRDEPKVDRALKALPPEEFEKVKAAFMARRQSLADEAPQ